MLFISFIIIFTCKKSGDDLKNRYNKKDCEVYDKYYTVNEKGEKIENEKGEKIVNESSYAAWYKIAEGDNDFIRE